MNPLVAQRAGALAASTLLLTSMLLATGCGSQDTTRIVRDPDILSEDATSTPLTALERGELRREALRVAKDGWAAFEANDTEAMSAYFADSIVEGFADRYAEYAGQGRERHREYEILFFDVTKMSDDGRDATVSVTLIDNSYFVEANGTRTEPYGKERTAQLMLISDDGESFVIRQFMAANAFME
jgi:hypothetical protein